MSNNDRIIKNPEGFIFSTAAMAELLGVSDRRIRQLVSEGIIEKSGRGRFNLQKTVQDLLTYWQKVAKAQRDQVSSKEDLEREKYFHEKAKRQIAELKLADFKQSLHESSEVERLQNELVNHIQEEALKLPGELAPKIVARKNTAEIQELLEGKINNLLLELSQEG